MCQPMMSFYETRKEMRKKEAKTISIEKIDDVEIKRLHSL